MGSQAADNLEGFVQIGFKGCTCSKYVTQERVHGGEMVHVGKVCVLRSDKEIHEKDPRVYRIPTIDFQFRSPVCISRFKCCLSTGIFNLVCPSEVAAKPTCNDELNVLYVWGCAREYLSYYQISLC